MLGQGCKLGRQGRVVLLCRQLLGPVQGQVELAAAVVELTGLGRRILVVVKQLARGGIQGSGQDLGLGVASLDTQLLDRKSVV